MCHSCYIKLSKYLDLFGTINDYFFQLNLVFVRAVLRSIIM